MPTKRILIAEDDLFLQQIYSRSLVAEGYDVETAADGKEALQKIASSPFDLLLIDLTMPVMSGDELIETLKRDPTHATIPFIVLTNMSEDEVSAKCKAWGAQGCFTKSNVGFEEIVNRIRSLIGKGNAAPKQEKVVVQGKESPKEDDVSDKKRRILVVEDDPFLLQIYRQNLEERGFMVTPVEGGTQALEILERDQHFSAVILDLLMPGMDGFTVLEKLKPLGVVGKIPVIVLTNLSQESDHKKALELGAADFAIKSELSFEEIVAKVESALSSSPSA